LCISFKNIFRTNELLEINELNNKCVDLIMEEKTKIALKLLKKAFHIIEVSINNKINLFNKSENFS